MNVHDISPSGTTPQRSRRAVSPLASLSGRDPDILAEAPADIRKESAGIGLALLIAAAIHWAGFVAAFYILNVPFGIASVVSALTAAGLFAVDRAAIHAFDLAAAETAVRRTDASDFPRLNGWFRKVIPMPLRIGFSVLTALFTGLALTLYFFEADLDARNALRQAELDQPFVEAAAASLSAERDALVRALEEADIALARHDEAVRLRADARQGHVLDLEGDETAMRARLEQLREDAQWHETEARRQRDLARCELEPDLPDCGDASGIAGDGPRYRAALERAEEAQDVADAAAAELALAEAEFATLVSEIERIRTTDTDDADARRRAELAAAAIAAATALGEFDAEVATRAEQMVASNPLREVIDPDSLSARLHAMQLLATENLGVLTALATVKLVAFAFEILALLKLAYMKSNEYHIRRGEALEAEKAKARSGKRKRFLDEANLRDAVRRKLREEARSAADDELADQVFEQAAWRAGA